MSAPLSILKLIGQSQIRNLVYHASVFSQLVIEPRKYTPSDVSPLSKTSCTPAPPLVFVLQQTAKWLTRIHFLQRRPYAGHWPSSWCRLQRSHSGPFACWFLRWTLLCLPPVAPRRHADDEPRFCVFWRVGWVLKASRFLDCKSFTWVLTSSELRAISHALSNVKSGNSCNFSDSSLFRIPMTTRSLICSDLLPKSQFSASSCKLRMKPSTVSPEVCTLRWNLALSCITLRLGTKHSSNFPRTFVYFLSSPSLAYLKDLNTYSDSLPIAYIREDICTSSSSLCSLDVRRYRENLCFHSGHSEGRSKLNGSGGEVELWHGSLQHCTYS